MPESPDFDTIALHLVTQGKAYDQAAVAKQLRLAWNGRGEADLVVIETQLSSLLGVTAAGPYVKNLERALKTLDR